MNIKLSHTDIAGYRDNEQMIKETALQVIKDFGTYGIDIAFPSDIKWAYVELFNQLEKHIADLLDNEMLLSLLYTIDVSEKIIKQVSNVNPQMPLSEVITELILERELKKVILRNYFKEQGI